MIKVVPESDARSAEKRRRLLKSGFAALAALFVAALAVIFALWGDTEPAGPKPVRRFAFTPEEFIATQHGRSATISPNGRHIAYVAGADQPAIWVRDLDQQQPRRLAGTDGAAFGWPFWSPDSQFIGFATFSELKKISVRGGTPITLCRLPDSISSGLPGTRTAKSSLSGLKGLLESTKFLPRGGAATAVRT